MTKARASTQQLSVAAKQFARAHLDMVPIESILRCMCIGPDVDYQKRRGGRGGAVIKEAWAECVVTV